MPSITLKVLVGDKMKKTMFPEISGGEDLWICLNGWVDKLGVDPQHKSQHQFTYLDEDKDVIVLDSATDMDIFFSFTPVPPIPTLTLILPQAAPGAQTAGSTPPTIVTPTPASDKPASPEQTPEGEEDESWSSGVEEEEGSFLSPVKDDEEGRNFSSPGNQEKDPAKSNPNEGGERFPSRSEQPPDEQLTVMLEYKDSFQKLELSPLQSDNWWSDVEREAYKLSKQDIDSHYVELRYVCVNPGVNPGGENKISPLLSSESFKKILTSKKYIQLLVTLAPSIPSPQAEQIRRDLCRSCLLRRIDTRLRPCGHEFCTECASKLQICPLHECLIPTTSRTSITSPSSPPRFPLSPSSPSRSSFSGGTARPTVLCRYFQQNRCQHGSKCTYAHGATALRGVHEYYVSKKTQYTAGSTAGCTVMALEAALNLFNFAPLGTSLIDSILEAGSVLYLGDQHSSCDEIFPKIYRYKEKMIAKDPKQCPLKNLSFAVAEIQNLCRENKQPVAAILTKPPESLLLYVNKDRYNMDKFIIFDSHGRNQHNLHGAYLLLCDKSACVRYLEALWQSDLQADGQSDPREVYMYNTLDINILMPRPGMVSTKCILPLDLAQELKKVRVELQLEKKNLGEERSKLQKSVQRAEQNIQRAEQNDRQNMREIARLTRVMSGMEAERKRLQESLRLSRQAKPNDAPLADPANKKKKMNKKNKNKNKNKIVDEEIDPASLAVIEQLERENAIEKQRFVSDRKHALRLQNGQEEEELRRQQAQEATARRIDQEERTTQRRMAEDSRLAQSMAQKVLKCRICMDDLLEDDVAAFSHCDHKDFHRECMQQDINSQLKDNNLPKCPICKIEANEQNADVITLIADNDLELLLNQECMALYRSLSIKKGLISMGFINCPIPDCTEMIDPSEFQSRATCGAGHAWCKTCNTDKYHDGQTCLEYKQAKSAADVDVKFNELKDMEGLAQCPDCKATIEKSEGCNKMVCSSCNAKLCYLCSAKLSDTDPYGHFKGRDPKSACALFTGDVYEQD
eukprot:gb/GEZN01000732.1/.p1 GENE.gb/GEZN01000732.1/~~gb/GEZN01000732.1/.p1  ORF type:complete len:1024 (+),score=167.56 gb/GEZN01000732.1/:87-3158(+)